MRSIFDPVLVELGFKRFFAWILVSTTLTFVCGYFLYPSAYPLAPMMDEILARWRESTYMNRAVGLLVGISLYVAAIFYMALTVYEYLLAKRASEHAARK